MTTSFVQFSYSLGNVKLCPILAQLRQQIEQLNCRTDVMQTVHPLPCLRPAADRFQYSFSSVLRFQCPQAHSGKIISSVQP